MENKNAITASKITDAFIEQQATTWKEAAEKANAAAEAYLADLEQRKAALAEQAAGYKAQFDKLNAQRKRVVAQINDFSSRGKIDEAAEAEATLEKLDMNIATLERKMRLVGDAELSGDAELYSVAKSAQEAMDAERMRYRESIATLRSIVDAESKRLESVSKELWYALGRDHGYYATAAFEKVDRNYRHLDRIEREQRDQANAQRKDRERLRGTVCHVMA